MLGRSSGRYLWLVAAAVVGLHLFGDRYWLGHWDETVRAATNSSFLLVLVATAGVAVDTRRLVVPAVPDARRSPRHLVYLTASWAAGTVWYALAYLAVVLSAGAATLATTPFRLPDPSIVAGGLGWIALHTAVGVLLGAALPLVLAVTLACALPYAAIFVLSTEPDTTAALFTALDDGLPFWSEYPPAAPVLWAQAGFFAAVGVAVVLAADMVFRRRVSATTVLAAAGLVLVPAAVLVAVGPEKNQLAAGARDPGACASVDSVTVCTHHDEQVLAEPLAAMLARLAAEAPSAPVPTRVVQDGVAAPDGTTVLSLSNVHSVRDLPVALTWSMVDELGCSDALTETAYLAMDARVVWLEHHILQTQQDRFGPPSPVLSQVAAETFPDVLEQPVADQWVWFSEARDVCAEDV